MKHWIFQGNTEQFPVSQYIEDNKTIHWTVRQKRYVKEIQKGDRVFIWRSDDSNKDTGGIIAHTEAVSDVYEAGDGNQVDLTILSYRLNQEDGMLMRHQLKNIPDTKMLTILQMPQATNYRLTKTEYDRLLNLWNDPGIVEKRLNSSPIDNYLHVFKSEASEYVQDNHYINESYQFFRTFIEPNNLETMTWEDVQKLGNYINAFRMPLARQRALGKMNASIEQYRQSFYDLLHGEDDISTRIDRFLTDPSYKLFGFGKSVVSEILGNAYPTHYCFYNQRDRVAIEDILNIPPDHERGDTFGQAFLKFQNQLKQYDIANKFKDIVGKQTELPIYYEVDQFFSFLYDYLKTKEEGQPSEQEGLLDYHTKDIFTVEEWQDMLTDESIFQAKDRTYLLKMYEWGGSASGTELGTNFSTSYAAVNAVIGNMSKRVYEANNLDISYIVGNQFRYWPLLFNGSREKQDDFFKWTMKSNLHEAVGNLYREKNIPYTKEDFLQEMFINEEAYDTITGLLDYKKNIILQGPPGVGKTFVAKRLAKSLVGEDDESNIEMIQFHQTYAYEDFVMGYRPVEKGFSLKEGIFYKFCKRAQENPEADYFFIIDEINRGNLSKIFGELFMLIEPDKRGEFVSLGYSGEKFTVPENVHIIGTMNTADRSLAQLEVALRRRFAFYSLRPALNEKWQHHMLENGLSDQMINRILSQVKTINADIRDDFQLGPGYEIGHSFFTTIPDGMAENVWYERIINFEIIPLLEEYYYDRPERVNELIEGL